MAAKHVDNRALIAKRMVGLLGSASAKGVERAVRVLMTISTFASDSAANQAAVAKTGGIPPLIVWLSNAQAQAQAARALLCVAADNTSTQTMIARSNAIPPLIALVRRGSPEGMDFAARALWHLASQGENQLLLVIQDQVVLGRTAGFVQLTLMHHSFRFQLALKQFLRLYPHMPRLLFL